MGSYDIMIDYMLIIYNLGHDIYYMLIIYNIGNDMLYIDIIKFWLGPVEK